jgi:hypothetical protein
LRGGMQRIADCSRTLKVLPCREQPGWLSFFCNHAKTRWQFRVAIPALKAPNDPASAEQPGAGSSDRQEVPPRAASDETSENAQDSAR